MQFFTLDRTNSLEGMTHHGLWDISPEGIRAAFAHLRGSTLDEPIPPERMARQRELYPGGLSLHGMRYLFARYPASLADSYEALRRIRHADEVLEKSLAVERLTRGFMIEQVFESVRLQSYPHLPSRYQSFFGFEKRDQMVYFNLKFSSRNILPSMWVVESDRWYRGDMSLLDNGASLAEFLDNAHRYWSGLVINQKMVECLLPLPIQIVRQLAY